MQFNTAPFLQDHAMMKAVVAAGDQDWRQDIGNRWGEFQLMLVARRTKSMEEHTAHPGIDTPKGREYLIDQEARIGKQRAMANAFISGLLEVPDPVDAEATLRLFALANTPKELPVPETVAVPEPTSIMAKVTSWTRDIFRPD